MFAKTLVNALGSETRGRNDLFMIILPFCRNRVESLVPNSDNVPTVKFKELMFLRGSRAAPRKWLETNQDYALRSRFGTATGPVKVDTDIGEGYLKALGNPEGLMH